MLMVMKKSRESGFTLVELLVVIIIIGILAAIAVPVFLNQRQRANDSELKTNIRGLSQTVEEAMITYPNAQYFALIGGSGRVQVRVGNSTSDYAVSNVAMGKKSNVALVKGDAPGSYRIYAYRDTGKQYKSETSSLVFDSMGGGIAQAPVSVSTARKNIATNGSVESSDLSTWTPYFNTPYTRTTAEAKEGNYSLALTVNSSTTVQGAWVNPGMPHTWVTGDEITASMWVKAPAGMNLAFGLRTATNAGGGWGAGVGVQSWTTSGDWEKKTISYTVPSVPESAYLPQITTVIPFPAAGTKIYIDGVMIEAGSTTQDDYIEDSAPGDISSGAWVKVS